MWKRIVVIGSNGQLGHDLVDYYKGTRPVGLTHEAIEVKDYECCLKVLKLYKPDVVINTAAYHKLENCERNPEEAYRVNALGAGNVALACAEIGATLIYISTDYVFSGVSGFYRETDYVSPINIYGKSKAIGEHLVSQLCEKHFIVRSSGLYGDAGSSGKRGNFVETMLRLAAEVAVIKVVYDQIMTPTPTRCLVAQIWRLIETDQYGIYHATCHGKCSWFEFATEIFHIAGLTPNLMPQSTAQSGSQVARPANSVLDNCKLERLGIDCMPGWKEGLAKYMELRNRPENANLRMKRCR